jgi:hypothetical protein
MITMQKTLEEQQAIYAEHGIEEGSDIIIQDLLNQNQETRLPFESKRVGVHEDGRVKTQITCTNELLEDNVSVVLNDNNIGLIPFKNGHLARIEAQKSTGESIVLFGFFSDTENGHNWPLHTDDECCYAESICITLTSGGTEAFFGSYDKYRG